MIKSIIFPDREFKTKKELFKCLKANEREIISLKKSNIHKSFEKGQLSYLNLDSNKIIGAEKNIGFEAKKDYIYPVISTTNYYDTHKDVHFRGSMTKTTSEQQGKVYYALDHKLEYDNILAWQKDVKMFVSEIPWGLVNKNYEGTTEALIFEIHKDKIRRKSIIEDIENKNSEFQNSIRMIYYKVTMGINDSDPEFKENKDYYEKKIDLIANKEDVEKDGYFFGIEELGIVKEGSLVVAGGSNDATSIYYTENKTEAVNDTSENNEPSDDTQKLVEFLTKIKV